METGFSLGTNAKRLPAWRFLVGRGDRSRLARQIERHQRTLIRLAPADLRAALRALHVTLDTMQTGPAIRTYNIMMGERRRVAAALIAVS